MSATKNAVSIFWFRRDLRLHDNVGLLHALQSGFPVIPVFIFDTNILNQLPDKADKRVDLILQMLNSLQQEIAKSGSSLLVKHGTPLEVFRNLAETFDIKQVYTNRDYEPYAIQRDREISDFLHSKNISFFDFKDQVIFEKNEVLKADGSPYTVFTAYAKAWKKHLQESHTQIANSKKLTDLFLKMPQNSIPDLQKIGFQKTDIVYQKPLISTEIISSYDKTRDFPAEENGTSMLSVHLRFGTVSIRQLVTTVYSLNETYLNELIWREFFMSILYHFPFVENSAFKKNYNNIKWRNDESEFEKWCQGKTGFPIVDAGMRQLNKTGLMHNRIRMITASFLTKDLLIDWRWGEAYFAQKLLDYDLAANNGNWQWVTGCGCDAAPYFRIFNPSEQTKKFDPHLTYINRWIPELNTFHYPQAIIDHALARVRTLNTFKAAFNQN